MTMKELAKSPIVLLMKSGIRSRQWRHWSRWRKRWPASDEGSLCNRMSGRGASTSRSCTAKKMELAILPSQYRLSPDLCNLLRAPSRKVSSRFSIAFSKLLVVNDEKKLVSFCARACRRPTANFVVSSVECSHAYVGSQRGKTQLHAVVLAQLARLWGLIGFADVLKTSWMGSCVRILCPNGPCLGLSSSLLSFVCLWQVPNSSTSSKAKTLVQNPMKLGACFGDGRFCCSVQAIFVLDVNKLGSDELGEPASSGRAWITMASTFLKLTGHFIDGAPSST